MEPELRRRLENMAIIALTASAAFGLGMLVKAEKASVPVRIDYFTQPAAPAFSGQKASNPVAKEVVQAVAGGVVASKKGTKYHSPWCPGASTISPENKIYFETPEAARAAGYQPAANCKGLK